MSGSDNSYYVTHNGVTWTQPITPEGLIVNYIFIDNGDDTWHDVTCPYCGGRLWFQHAVESIRTVNQAHRDPPTPTMPPPLSEMTPYTPTKLSNFDVDETIKRFEAAGWKVETRDGANVVFIIDAPKSEDYCPQ